MAQASPINTLPNGFSNRFIENLNKLLAEVALFLDARSMTKMSRADKKLEATFSDVKKRFSQNETSIEVAIDEIISAIQERKSACALVSVGKLRFEAPRSAQEARLFRALASYLDIELRNWASYFPSVDENFVREMKFIRPNFLSELHENEHVVFENRNEVPAVSITRRLYDRTMMPFDLDASDTPMIGDFKDVFPIPEMLETRASR